MILRALWRERRHMRRALAAGTALALCTVGLTASSAWLLFRSSERPPVLSLTVMMGLVQLFALGRSATRYAERTLIHRAGLAAMGHVRLEILTAATRLLPAGLGPRSDEILTAVLSDVIAVQQMLTASLSPIVIAVAGSIVTLILATVVDHSLAIVGGTLALTGVVLPYVGGQLRRSSEIHIEHAQIDIRRMTTQILRDRDGVRTSARLDWALQDLACAERSLASALHHRGWWQGCVNGSILVLNGLCVMWLTVHGLHLYHAGMVSWPLVAVMPLTMLTASDLLSAIPALFATAPNQWRSLRRIEALTMKETPVTEPTLQRASPAIKELRAHHLSSVVNGVPLSPPTSFDCAPGDVIAITGPSGCGKSSLARTLVRFVEYEGTLTADLVELSEWHGTQVRESVGYVDDAPYVFATTLRENVSLARPDASDEEILAALHSAQLSELLASMPERLDTQLGGRADQISGGERRRLGVARELLSHRRVVILDEPTEGLDLDTADALLSSLRAEHQGRALVVISHLSLETLEPTKRITL